MTLNQYLLPWLLFPGTSQDGNPAVETHLFWHIFLVMTYFFFQETLYVAKLLVEGLKTITLEACLA